jgi:hypothetical protein
VALVAAVSCVAFTKVVDRVLGIPPTPAPNILTIAPLLNPVPLIVIVLSVFSLMIPVNVVTAGGESIGVQPFAV